MAATGKEWQLKRKPWHRETTASPHLRKVESNERAMFPRSSRHGNSTTRSETAMQSETDTSTEINAEIEPGTHLTTRRRGYVHHGLYVGGGRVIHYAGLDRRFRRGPVEEVSLERFAGGRGWQVVPRSAPAHPGTVAVARARSRLGENRYSIWSNNCEHLVEWAVAGTPRSTQVDGWAARLRSGLGVLRAATMLRSQPG
jgi:Lecithin retinol acyltransferase